MRSQGTGGLSAFPVEIVYVEEGTKPDPKGRGNAKVMLPLSSEPITHLMVDLYVPKEGEYSGFAGSLRKVDAFTQVGPAAPAVNAAVEAQALQQQVVVQQAAKVSAAGASPIEVQLPVSGQVFHFEKILVIKDEQWFSYDFQKLHGKWLGMF
ncbi:MAG: hypothetical protein NTX50_27785 [Candidatus Sumerlaeota bacterium]|nr:hypothetical protein [Candidatus Sumerlaeota bacterium]